MRKKTLIRPADPDDLRDIFLLGSDVFQENTPDSYGWAAEDLADILSSPDCIVFAAIQRKKIIGFIIGSIFPKNMKRHSAIQWICVMEKQRGRGTGRMLCESFFMESRAQGYGQTRVRIPGEVPVASEFFKKIGFTEKSCFITLDLNLHLGDY